jgi:signal transduction histidine kinase
VRPLIRRLVEAVASLAWQLGQVQVLAELPDVLPRALVDPARLEQVLSNLLRNAIRHTPPGGIVAVVASEEVERVRIEVRDTGEGISAEDLPHIWERFYRGRDSAAREGAERGAGLGLALVKELTEVMGGTVAVESTPGEGSCFTVRVPRVAE